MRVEEVRGALAARLRERRPEIERAILIRTHGVSDPAADRDPIYEDGLRAAVSASVEYGIEALERGENRAPPIPTTLLSQARLAARFGIRLETVLRRYFAGYTSLEDFVIEEVERADFADPASLQRILRAQAALFDRVIAAVSEEYKREGDSRPSSSEDMRVGLVRGLLDGDLLDASELAYDLETSHLGAIAVGYGSVAALRDLGLAMSARTLIVRDGRDSAWLWFGSRGELDPAALEGLASTRLPLAASFAIGEPGEALEGWRLTHRQAAAALPIATRGRQPIVRYSDVALLAAMLRDDILSTSLRQLYLEPLERDRDGGKVAKETLRAYFATDRNASSAAAALGVSRQTVGRYLRAVERQLGRPLHSCAVELEAALRSEELAEQPCRNVSHPDASLGRIASV